MAPMLETDVFWFWSGAKVPGSYAGHPRYFSCGSRISEKELHIHGSHVAVGELYCRAYQGSCGESHFMLPTSQPVSYSWLPGSTYKCHDTSCQYYILPGFTQAFRASTSRVPRSCRLVLAGWEDISQGFGLSWPRCHDLQILRFPCKRPCAALVLSATGVTVSSTCYQKVRPAAGDSINQTPGTTLAFLGQPCTSYG